LGVYGIVLAGWASNNKYSLLGGLRSSAQMISYELSLGLSIVGVLLLTGSLSLREMVYAQYGLWNVVKQPLAFFIFLVAVFAETNRLPFDLPEAETELVAGYHTEYAGMKFAMFFMAEYANMVTASALIVTLFFGGWMIPFVSTLEPSSVWLSLLELLAFIVKVSVVLFLFVWVRWTIPRFRYDQLMMLGWKVLLPLALLNIFVTAGVVALT
jgi:NADH-quinone oxidoreductase subunit H